MNIREITDSFKNCECGRVHETSIKRIEAGRGYVKSTGKILKECGFGKRLVLVADKNTLFASDGILNSLEGFDLIQKIYEDKRTAEMTDVREIEALLKSADGVLAVGTGSVHDICRLAAFNAGKKLALFATAASMDGFASDGAPIVDNGFKETHQVKPPDVIIADTDILAAAPAELKSAGFGDMIAKYIGLIDWQVSALLTGEYYCKRVAALTRQATDRIMSLKDKITANDGESAKAVFEALILTGIAMNFTKNSRPASGTEHILSHFWECKKLQAGELSDFHGKKVGVATLLVMREYEKMAAARSIKAHMDETCWEEVYSVYGNLSDDVRRLNTPTVTAEVNPKDIESLWGKIKEIISGVPTAAQMLEAMQTAGCAVTCGEIGISPDLESLGLCYHPYMRHRLSLMRLRPMIDFGF